MERKSLLIIFYIINNLIKVIIGLFGDHYAISIFLRVNKLYVNNETTMNLYHGINDVQNGDE